MQATLTIIRYKKRHIYFALLAMALHHIPLWLNRSISFYKLLGTGRNGTFDKNPDWQQWGILAVHNNNITPQLSYAALYGNFISRWLKFFGCETCTFFLEPMEGHGSWDGKQCFGKLNQQPITSGPVAVLTRATIRFSKMNSFWKNVGPVAAQMSHAGGLITSVGIGEMPFIKQATFSVWEDAVQMKEFAYRMQQHAAVIRKTRKENWYSEEMFVRFKPLAVTGTIRGKAPLDGIL